MEHQRYAVLHYLQSTGCIDISFQSESIDHHYRERGMWHAYCPIREISVKGASLIFSLASWMFQRPCNEPNQVLAKGSGNPPAVQVQTAKMVQVDSSGV